MLRSAQQSYGSKLSATDGEIGHVKDFYFDDQEWVVRYVVADTGFWLSGHLVLLSPRAFESFSQDGERMVVNLSRKKIEDSPPIEAHTPVSRQFEERYHQYYDWPSYWEADGMWGAVGLGITPPPHIQPMKEETWGNPTRDEGDSHLQSAKALTGYQIQTKEGVVGEVLDFMIDAESWTIRQVLVQTGHILSKKEIVISPSNIDHISHEESKVFLSLTKEDILHAPERHTSGALVHDGPGIADRH
jgi:hypothetical protein